MGRKNWPSTASVARQTDPKERGLLAPVDKRGPMLSLMTVSSRGKNSTDPRYEDPKRDFSPFNDVVDSYRSDGHARLMSAEMGTGGGKD